MIDNLRAAIRLTLILGWLGIALVFHGLWRLVRAPSPWPRFFLGGVARLFGARPRFHGTPLRRDVVFLSNHVSWLDILLIGGRSGSAFVAKAELATAPIVGWLCTLNRTIFVNRGDRMGVAAQVEELRAAMREAWAVTIFPEGTTSGAATMLPFKATLLAAIDPPPPGLRIQPIWIDYGPAREELAWTVESGQDNGLRILRRPGRFAVGLTFLGPFDPAGMDRKAIAAEARARIAAASGRPVA